MRSLSHVVAMHIIDVTPAKVKPADRPAQELYSYEQAEVTVSPAYEEIPIKRHNN